MDDHEPTSRASPSDSHLIVENTTPAERARQHIDQEILRYQCLIQDLRTQRNTFAPISQLPPEILCRVFLFTRPAYEIHAFPYLLKWTTVSHVSRHWRDIALNEPALWINPPLNCPKWAMVMLARSQMAGLVIKVDVGAMKREVVSAALQHISHITQLSILKAHPGPLRELLAGLPTTAPKLEALCINYPSSQGYSAKDNPNEFVDLPNNIFCDSVRLRRLQISRVNIDWNSHLLNSLTTLALHNISPSGRPTAKQFMAMLEKMPYLESLSLQHASPSKSSQDVGGPSSGKPLLLAHLKNLFINSTAPDVEFFFNHVTVPSQIKVAKIGIYYAKGSKLEFASVLSAICRAYSSKSLGANIRSLEIELRATTQFGVSFKTSKTLVKPNYEFDSKPGRLTTVDLELAFSTSQSTSSTRQVNSTSNKIVTDFFNSLHLTNLVEVNLIGNLGLTTDTLAKTFGSLPKLRTVIVGIASAPPLLATLQLGSNIDPADNPRSIIFPALWCITMEGVSFDPEDGEGLQVEELQDCLMSRCERGAEIRTLRLIECRRLNMLDVDSFNEIVVDVDWDMEELGFDDDEYMDSDVEEEDYYSDEAYMGRRMRHGGYDSDSFSARLRHYY